MIREDEEEQAWLNISKLIKIEYFWALLPWNIFATDVISHNMFFLRYWEFRNVKIMNYTLKA